MPHTPTPPAVIVKVAREQHGYLSSRAICPWCGQPGATEPHHWLLKRSAAVPPRILHDPRNIVLLHYPCHDLYGQTEAMVQRCYHHKIKKLFYQKGRPGSGEFYRTTLSGRPYDIMGWIEELRAGGLLVHVPILPVLDDREEKLFEAN